MSVVIRLEPAELAFAGMIGVARRVSALNKGRPSPYNFEGDAWSADVDGAAAEMAVAKHLDRYWQPLTNGSLRDLRGDVSALQVRSTPREDGCLILHETDPDVAFFLVVTNPPLYTIVGWLYASEGQNQLHWRENVSHAGLLRAAGVSAARREGRGLVP